MSSEKQVRKTLIENFKSGVELVHEGDMQSLQDLTGIVDIFTTCQIVKNLKKQGYGEAFSRLRTLAEKGKKVLIIDPDELVEIEKTMAGGFAETAQKLRRLYAPAAAEPQKEQSA